MVYGKDVNSALLKIYLIEKKNKDTFSNFKLLKNIAYFVIETALKDNCSCKDFSHILLQKSLILILKTLQKQKNPKATIK